MCIRQLSFLSAILAFMCLFTPFIWLQIGPGGYNVYGPDVPDIYILGATILGKDRSFEGINFAYKFQLVVIVYFISTSLWTAVNAHKNITVKRLTLINTILLLLFPLWLTVYTDGVIGNSDGADLIIHLYWGMVLYTLLLLLHIVMWRRIRKPAGPEKAFL